MKYLITLALVFLTGCASNDYQAYGQAQSAIAQAKANADTARYQALSKIAETGTESSRIAAVMALALGNGSQTQATQIAAPQPSQALQWAQVLAPSLTSIASMHYASRTALASAESAARVSESTNSAFLGIAGKIQAPVTVVPQTITPVVAAPVLPQANVTTTTTTTDNHAITTTSANPTTTTTTLSGAGVIGAGSYSTTTTPAPVVVTPTVTAPVVVTPVIPAPVITPVIQVTPIAQPTAPAP